MRVPIDIVFIDNRGEVLRVCPSVPPWRVVIHWRASEVWELRAGEARRWGLRSPARMNRRAERGASTLEVLLALILVIWPLTSALLEFSQLAVARHALQHALSEAARAAERVEEVAASGHLARVVAHHLLPAIAAKLPDESSAGDMASAIARAQSLALLGHQLQVRVEAEHIVGDPVAFGAQQLRLQGRWCRPMYFAPAKQFIAQLAASDTLSIFDQLCLRSGGFPLGADAYAWRPVSRPPIAEP